MTQQQIILCPGQGAQTPGMGRAWFESSAAAAAIFQRADAIVHIGGEPLSKVAFDGAPDTVHRTDVSQPALYTCAIASLHALQERGACRSICAAAGLSLGEYTALHIAGAFTFEDGLQLVAERGRQMQAAAQASKGGMVALIGADEAQAQAVCDAAAQGEVLVCANFNAPGQIVLSGHSSACDRALDASAKVGCRATKLQVAGAFHSPLMAPAAEAMAAVLDRTAFRPLQMPVWSNVTARPHDSSDANLLRRLLVDQIVRPVQWSQSMAALSAETPSGDARPSLHELAPGSVLKGLMRRIDRTFEVTTHDKPEPADASKP
ncbi:MAG: ACP S-malonyltransferase [Planctomycetes bacterium]|nr:ACP S-malonyltransferase [Planctomycetota bacterium]